MYTVSTVLTTKCNELLSDQTYSTKAIALLQNEIDLQLTAVSALQKKIVENSVIREKLFANKVPKVERETAQDQVTQAELIQDQFAITHTVALKRSSELSGSVKSADSQLAVLVSESKETNVMWSDELLNSPFENENTFLDARLSDQVKEDLSNLKEFLNTATIERNQGLKDSDKALKELQQSELHQEYVKSSLDEVVESISGLTLQNNENSESKGAITARFEVDLNNRKSQTTLLKEIDQQQNEYQDIVYLDALIGSAKGDKFRRFAQTLTLEHLVILANTQLARLHARYLLQRNPDEELGIMVLDTWQGDTVRNTKTLSGGESFLVSLALALGLSDLVSHKASIDSLFLDEGFGTLDAETLDIALDALDSLNASGKMIGVISHVDAMKERIPVQIKVNKMSGMGLSTLDAEFAC